MLEDAEITCPYCGEHVTMVVDASVGDQHYVEDCFVCCQPIALTIHIENGALISVDARTESD